jgi:hypothetical protein
MKKFALLLLVAPLVLAACGGGSSSSAPATIDPVAYVKHSAQKTADTPSEHMTMTAHMNVGPMSMTMSGSGDYANTTHSGSFTFGASLLAQSFKITEVLAGTSIYMTSPLMTKDLPAGKTWVKLDLAKAAKAAHGVDISSLMSRTPTQALQQLEAAGTVTQVGQGAKLAAIGQIKYGPIDVWIGNADRYVYRETMSFSVKASGQSTSMTMRSDYSKFGEKVSVTVPLASETTDASALPGFGG